MTYVYKVPPGNIKRFALICKLCALQNLNYGGYYMDSIKRKFFFQAPVNHHD